MKGLKKGNVTLMLFPIGVMILIVILIAVTILYIQIVVQIYEIKSNLFYIVSSSICKEDMEKLAYRDYSLDAKKIQESVNYLLEKNYLTEFESKGIIGIQCQNLKIIEKENFIIEHTENRYNTPIICISVNITFKPVVSLIGDKFNFKIHDDVKISLLEFSK